MSSFVCEVVRVEILAHDNADSLELAKVGGYLSVVKKGQYKTGDLAVYLPEQSILPGYMLKEFGFWDDLNGKGKLHGGDGNRIRAMKLRGVLSQGLLVDGRQTKMVTLEDDNIKTLDEMALMLRNVERDAICCFFEGDDAAEFLGVTKYEPTVPTHMAGKLVGGDLEATIGYDFENLKKIPDLFDDGEQVCITEKLHGTLVQIGLIPEAIYAGKKWAEKVEDTLVNGVAYKVVVTSKGQGSKGLMIDPTDESNLYVKVTKQLDLWTKLGLIRQDYGVPSDKPVFLLGEIFGMGVQDLTYGQSVPAFRAFDIYVGTRSDGHYLDYSDFSDVCENTAVPIVPVIYVGPYSAEVVAKHTDGVTIFDAKQIREGVVVKAFNGGSHRKWGRKIAKSVSGAYLTRKGDVSEYQ